MKNFEIQADYCTPQISFNIKQNEFTISGESYVEYAYEFYKPVMNWLKNYLNTNQIPLTFQFKFTYFNTPSSAIIYEMLKLLEKSYLEQKVPIKVTWLVPPSNEELLEEGRLFKEDFPTLPFELVTPK